MFHRAFIMVVVLTSLTLVGCAGSSRYDPKTGTTSSPVLSSDKAGSFKVGKTYKVSGKNYHPQESYTFTQTGLASWYGPGFNGRMTANGERFNENEMTAAHPTLQMPSLVRVTNLENKRSIVVRINDRGPFHGNRIIDLSKGAAQKLDVIKHGLARVKVQVLGPESKALAAAARQKMSTQHAEIAVNETGRLDERFAAFYPNTVQAEPVRYADARQYIAPPTKPDVNGLVTMIDASMTSELSNATVTPEVAAMTPKPVMQMAPVMDSGTPYPPKMPMQRVALASPSSNIYVQAGTYISRADAHASARAIEPMAKEYGENTEVGSFIVSDQPYFRVRIGPMESVEKAEQVVNTLTRNGRQASVIASNN